MLEIVVPGVEIYNETTNEFIDLPETKLTLEHSLISIKKWESKWHKPFLSDTPLTTDEAIDYIKCMCINKVDNDMVFQYLPESVVSKIERYIKDPMTATWFSKADGTNKLGINKKEIVTNEIIYYNMIALNIPIEFQKWHLNQLLTLIKVCNLKSQKKQKMSRKQEMAQRDAINRQRRAKYNSKG